MIAWLCEHCSAEVKQQKEPDFCPLCGKKGKWDSVNLPDPSKEDLEFTEKFEEVIKTIEKYEEGTPQRKLSDAVACCGGGCCNETRKKRHN